MRLLHFAVKDTGAAIQPKTGVLPFLRTDDPLKVAKQPVSRVNSANKVSCVRQNGESCVWRRIAERGSVYVLVQEKN